MSESVGNSLLLYVVVFVVGAVMLFYVGIISYSKAYRVKDNMIEIIEKNKGYTYDSANPSTVQTEINDSLKQSGYSVVASGKINELCESGSVLNHIDKVTNNIAIIENLHTPSANDYNYCVFRVTDKSAYEGGVYYVVVAFVHFDFPVIGDRLNIPVYGETKILGKTYNY